MSSSVRAWTSALVGGVMALLVSIVVGPASAAEAPVALVTTGVTALYEMNEPAGTTVMVDSSGNGNDGIVDPTGVESGGEFDGATGYNWVYRSPTAPPASPERVVQVPDDVALEPAGQDFTIELRVRFTDKFGNIAQKGQSATPGGQWKIQAPQGIPSCLFKGSGGQVATGAKTALDDGRWHMLTCALDSAGVRMYVDGELRSSKLGTVGTIDNTFPMTIGGKLDCDQVQVTCDYYTGQVDSLRITKGPNATPSASFTSSCPGLTCAFDATPSSDPDGTVASYAWVFGDGTTGTGSNPTHVYGENGTYRVKLTVTDNRGATDVSIRDLTVEGIPVVSQVQHVATNVGVGNSETPTVAVPATAAPGDRLLLVLSLNSTSRTFTGPTGIAGATQLDTNIAKTMSTTVWTKTLETGDPGSTVTVPLTGGLTKYTLTAAVYSGVDETASLAFAHDVGLVDATSRVTPLVSAVPDGSWVVSYWADKSSSTTAWTPSASVVTRGSGCGTSSARICSALADSNAKVAAVYGNISATVNAPSSAATMWSIVLPTATGGPLPNQDPEAGFTSSCAVLGCTFDSSSSSDPEDALASYAWTFGDGGISNAANPSHTYAAAGTYDVTLTVTDEGGLSDSVTHQVTVDGLPPAIGFVGSAAATSSTSQPGVVVPTTVASTDRLLLALTVNSTTPTFGDPAGWTRLGTAVAKTMSTTVWTKAAGAADSGTTVRVPLSAAAKSTLTVAAYRGAGSGLPTFASATLVTSATARQTPAVTAPAGAWVVSHWADKSSTTTAWSTAGATSRQALCASGSGRVCSLLADSGAPVSGLYGPITASTDTASSTATMWSVVLTPA